MAAFSDRTLSQITWNQVEKFGKTNDSSLWVFGGSWDYMDLDTKRLFLEDLEKVCGVEFRLDTMTSKEASDV